jgi:DNA-binding CsgD family transcriptional regulator
MRRKNEGKETSNCYRIFLQSVPKSIRPHYNELIKEYSQLPQKELAPSVFFIYDLVSEKYTYFSPHFEIWCGYKLGELENHFESLVHPDDAEVLANFPCEIIPVLMKLQLEERPKVNVCQNFRIITRENKQMHLLHEIFFPEFDAVTGMPLYTLNLLNDISLYKTDNHIHLSMFLNDKEKRTKKEIFFRKYHLFDNESLISKREKEIVQLLANGLNSREIADQLFISEDTVKTHRRNLLSRLQARSTIELVMIAISRRII